MKTVYLNMRDRREEPSEADLLDAFVRLPTPYRDIYTVRTYLDYYAVRLIATGTEPFTAEDAEQMYTDVRFAKGFGKQRRELCFKRDPGHLLGDAAAHEEAGRRLREIHAAIKECGTDRPLGAKPIAELPPAPPEPTYITAGDLIAAFDLYDSWVGAGEYAAAALLRMRTMLEDRAAERNPTGA